MKACKVCNKSYDLTEFHKNKCAKDGLDKRCKNCCKDYKRLHRLENIDKYKERRNKAYLKIKDNEDFKRGKAKYDKEYVAKNIDKVKKRIKEWEIRTKPERRRVAREWLNNKRATDLRYKLNTRMSNSIRDGLKSRKSSKSWKTFVDYTIDDLVKHLESKFTKGMSWETHGLHGWHIDHIVPVSSFDFSKNEDIRKCWALSNLQPLWATTKIAMSHGEGPDYIGNIEKNDNY